MNVTLGFDWKVCFQFYLLTRSSVERWDWDAFSRLKNDLNFFNQALFQCQCHLDTPSTSRLPRSFRRSLSSAWLWLRNILAQIPSPRKHQHQHQQHQHQHHQTNHPPGVTQSGEYEWRGSCKENTGQTQAASARRTFSNLFILHFLYPLKIIIIK